MVAPYTRLGLEGYGVRRRRAGPNALSLATAPPVLDQPVLVQVHTLVATNLNGVVPDLGTPIAHEHYVLAAIPFDGIAPVVEAPMLHQGHNLVALDLAIAPPSLDTPVTHVAQFALEPLDLDGVPPELDAPELRQVHILESASDPILPALDTPALHQVHYLFTSALVTAPPVLATPVPGIGVFALNLDGAPPQLGKPQLKIFRTSTLYYGFGSQILYRSATELEKSMADVDAERLIGLSGIKAELIIENWEPWLVQERNLPYLAWGLGVTLWEDDYWSMGTKRQWVADQWTYKSLRGTVSGIRRALAPSDYDLVDWVGPPQGFYASEDLTPAQLNAWIALMPELRIYRADRIGTHGLDEIFADLFAAADQDAVSVDDGFALRGKYAILRHLGIDTPLHTTQYVPLSTTRPGVEFERILIPGKSSIGFCAEDSAADDGERFVCFEEKVPGIFTLEIDRQYSVDVSKVTLSTLVPSLDPIIPTFTTNSDIGDGGPFVFVGDHSDDRFADRTDGAEWLLAERLFLHDPAVADPMTEGMSFSDLDRVGVPAYTMELMVDLKTSEPLRAVFVDSEWVDEGFAVPEDLSHIERAFRAVVDAKALRDTALVTFAPMRPVELGDITNIGTTYAAWTQDRL